MMYPRGRGNSLALVIFGMAVLACLAFSAAGSFFAQASMDNRISQSLRAQNLAEAAVHRAIARLIEDPGWGSSNQSLEVDFPNGPGTGRLSFDRSAGPAWSTNNLLGSNAVEGSLDNSVEQHTAHLVGVGRAGGETRKVEVQLYIPRFPYVVASSGPIRSQGNLQIASVDSAADLAEGIDNIPASKQRPGHIASNAKALALSLSGPNIVVSGDVQSAGAVTLGPGVQVKGEVRPFSNAVGIPKISLSDYDPNGRPGLSRLSRSDFANLAIDGVYRRSGDLRVGQGLELKDGLLYVEGNLEVEGGLRGRGAVIVTGTTSIRGGGEVQSDNLAALLSRGSVQIEGTAGQRASLQGLVYTEGNFAARQVNLAGTFVANSPEESGSQMDIQDAKLINLPQAASLQFLFRQAGQAPSPGRTSVIINMNPNLPTPGLSRQGDLQGPSASPVFGFAQLSGGTGPVETRLIAEVVVGDPAVRKTLTGTAALDFLAGQAQIPPRQLLDAWIDALDSIDGNMEEVAAASPGPLGPNAFDTITGLDLDLSKFVRKGEQIRVLSWRRLP